MPKPPQRGRRAKPPQRRSRSTRPTASEGLQTSVFGNFRIGGVPLHLTATFGTDGGPIFSAQLGDVSLGEMVQRIVHLADPGGDFKLAPPWDVLNSVNLHNLTFKIDSPRGRVGFSYEHMNVDLKFLTIDAVELWYTASPKDGKSPSVDVSLFGRFLDKRYDYPDKPLTWDLLTQPPPTVPSGQPKTFELEYLGLGQHVTLRDPGKLTTMQGIIDGLMAAYDHDMPPDANPMDSVPLKFDASSGWLIGTRFSVLDTLELSMVFNDPVLYGIRLALSGERAKSFAGLEFEILYRKVTDEIGVFHTEFKLPESMRQLEFGAASITLPVVVLDIYTNGNFLVDLGFPYNLDFSRSFTIQAFVGPVPVIGAGGVYFGVLNGETSASVPQISNGRFAPVIEFGLGLQIGVGKTFNKGVLKAGIVIAIEGLLEGTLAFFEPEDKSLPKDTFYRISGTIALVGHIYGEVDFAIIKARVDVYAYASVSATMQAYEAMVLVLEAGVRVKLSVKVAFFTIKLEFSATVRESISIGQSSTPPWHLATGQQDRLRLDRPVAFSRMAKDMALMDAGYAALHAQGLNWQGVRVLSEVRTLDLYFQPMISAGLKTDRPAARGADPADAEPAATAQLIALLFVPHADPADPGPACFDDLARAALLWTLDTIKAAAGQGADVDDGNVTRSQIEFISHDLDAPRENMDLRSLIGFLRENFRLRIRPMPTDADAQAKLHSRGLTLFPMPPYLSVETSDQQHAANFQTLNPCSTAYRKTVDEYYRELDAQARAAEPEPEPVEALMTANDAHGPDSLAAMIFGDYFRIVVRQIVQAALNAFEGYRYKAAVGDTLHDIAARFGIEGEDAVERMATANQDNTEFFFLAEDGGYNALHFDALRVQVLGGESLAEFAARVQLTPAELATHAQEEPGLLRLGATVSIADGRYKIRTKDTLAKIATRFATTVAALLGANPDADWRVPQGSTEDLPVGADIALPALEYAVQMGDTLKRIGDFFGLTVERLVAIEANRESKRLLLALCPVPLPAISYSIAADDTPLSVARRFGLTAREVVAANPGPDTIFGTVALPDCETLPLSQLLDLLAEHKAYAGASGAVARFLLNGMRLPDPGAYSDESSSRTSLAALRAGHEDWADIDLYPLYVLTGQQWSAPQTLPDYTITLSKNALDADDPPECQRPLINFDSDHPDRYLTIGLAPEDQRLIGDYAKLLLDPAKPPFDPAILYNARYRPYQVMPKHFAVGDAVEWDAALLPDYGQGTQVSGMPTLYPLSPALQALLRSHPQRTHDLRLMRQISSVPGQQSADAGEITAKAWATRLDFSLRRAADATDAATFLPHVYELFSTDVAGRNTLRELIAHLRQHADLDVRIDLLYPANPADGRDAALRSDAVIPSEVFVLKANLSTDTHPVRGLRAQALRAEAEPALLSHASLTEPRKFLTLLWEASVVNTGGYYLFYRIGDEQGDGLPPQLFNQTSAAALTVLVTAFPATGKTSIAAEPFHNYAISVENAGDTDAVVYVAPPVCTIENAQTFTAIAAALDTDVALLAEANATLPHVIKPGIAIAPASGKYTVQLGDDLLSIALLEAELSLAAAAAAVDAVAAPLVTGARIYLHPDWVVRKATLAAGQVGFTLLRADPDPEATAERESTAQDTPATRLQTLFNLLSYRLTGQGGFARSAEALPSAPSESHRQELNPPPQATAPWRYARALSIAEFANPVCAPAAAPAVNPYAGLGQDAELSFELYDLFGNRCLPNGAIKPLSATVLYSDPLLGLSQWPSTAATYEFFGLEAGPQLRISLSFDPQRYVPALGEPFDGPLARVRADHELCARVNAQISQDDIRFTALSSVENSSEAKGSTLDREMFRDYIREIDAYLETLAELVQKQHKIAHGQSLHDVACLYQLPVESFGLGNAKAPGLVQPGSGNVLIPTLYIVVQNDSLASIAARADTVVSAGALADLNAWAPLRIGAVLDIDGVSVKIDRPVTLTMLAGRYTVEVAAIGAANAAVANLFAEGTLLLLKVLQVDAVADDTLASIAARHRLSLTDLCVANAYNRNLLVPGAEALVPNHLSLGTAATATHCIEKGDTLHTLAAQYRVGLVALVAANLDLEDILQTGTALTYGAVGKIEVRDGDTLATILSRLQNLPAGAEATAAGLAEQNQDLKQLLSAGARMLVPPQQQSVFVPVAPKFPSLIFAVKAWVAITRDAALIDPALRDEKAVRESRTELGPELADAAQGENGIKLADFAARFEMAFPRLKLATGTDEASGGAPQRGLMAVQFQNQTMNYKIERAPYFFAPRPLQNKLWASRPDAPVPVQAYHNASLQAAVPSSFEGVDLDTWGREFLEDMDRLLSPAFAIASHRADSRGDAAQSGLSFDRIVEAKNTLAGAIRDSVAEVVAAPQGAQTPADIAAAREALYQGLLVELASAYRVDTIVQFPVEVDSPYEDTAIAPRLSGQVTGANYSIEAQATLGQLAARFDTPRALLAEVLADAADILTIGVRLSAGGHKATIKQGSTLRSVAGKLAVDLATLADNERHNEKLLRTGATLNLVTRSYETANGDTFGSVLELLDDAESMEAAAHIFSAMNGDTPDLLTARSAIAVAGPAPDDRSQKRHTVKRGETLNAAAKALAITPAALVLSQLDQPGLINSEVDIRYLTFVPGVSLSDAKVKLCKGSSLTFLFQTASNRRFRRIPLELSYEITEIEYDIGNVDWAPGYQTSRWLTFVNPITDRSSMGATVVPVALRAYPVAPTILGQSTQQTPAPEPKLQDLKSYTYSYSYAYTRAAQDQLYTTIEDNITPLKTLRAAAETDTLPYWLARYDAVRAPLWTDLAKLANSGGNAHPTTIAALSIFADFAHGIAQAWTQWTRQPELLQASRPENEPRFRVRVSGPEQASIHADPKRSGATHATPTLQLAATHSSTGGATAGTGDARRRGELSEPAPFGATDLVFTHTVTNLNVIQTQNIQGTVSVQRNAELLPDRPTSPEFIYKVPRVRPADTAWPLLTHRQPVAMSAITSAGRPQAPKPLQDHLVDFFGELLEVTSDSPSTLARPLRVAVSYAYALNEQERARGRAAGSDAIILTRIPLVLRAADDFVPARDLTSPEGLCANLAAFLLGWTQDNAVWDHGGSYCFDVTLYSNLGGAGDAKPLIELPDIRLPLSEIARP